MHLIDTHSHLYLEEFDPDREELVHLAKENGIVSLLFPNIDRESVSRLHKICDYYPDFCYPMMGLHPTSVSANYVSELIYLESLLSKRMYCGIGEIGIDLYWDKTFLKEQKLVFEEQLRWSIEMKLPVSIHTRNAFPEVFDSIFKVGADKLSGVFHSFSGTEDELRIVLSLKNFKLGINGIVTYKNSDLPIILKQTTMKNIVLETDAPYLPPVPFRGRRNVPVYMLETLKKVAEIFEIPLEKAASIIEKNTKEIFAFVR
ncbi:MAG: TatD family hydrolase [Massilibacteroides sp.]|nr:TatD family hydrolase [Massilibacteroides sp.]MDD3062677.1 TatD family hydrolase [Massilibacteroides sp.]MDD4114733.1 TatD family hydrolase [Massilibacteroides sp.]MDD4660170.1 TatD family hydrolase [Massilibacteroides sp.]